MEEFLYLFTRAILLLCIFAIVYVINVSRNDMPDQSDLW
jgi:hypothetical protein